MAGEAIFWTWIIRFSFRGTGRGGQKEFKNFTRMSTRTFDDLLAKVGPKICRQDTTFRECISPRTRLLLTLNILPQEKPFRAYIMASEFQYHLYHTLCQRQ
jgi:hypothetical protein